MKTTTMVATLVSVVVFAVGIYIVGTKVGGAKHVPAKNCGGGDCDVTIIFDCSDPSHPSTTTCVPHADPDVVVMRTGHKIKFKLDNNTFSFDPTDGIKFTSDNSKTFLPCYPPQGSSGKMYTCENNIPPGTPADVYKYRFNITGFSVVDPFMVNY